MGRKNVDNAPYIVVGVRRRKVKTIVSTAREVINQNSLMTLLRKQQFYRLQKVQHAAIYSALILMFKIHAYCL